MMLEQPAHPIELLAPPPPFAASRAVSRVGEPNLRELEPDRPLVEAAGRNCSRVLFGVEPIDPLTFVGVIP
jgi:hypothetical protein